jgi:acyl-CoA synthetase (AMP-forming)/AMP-acid ligase II
MRMIEQASPAVLITTAGRTVPPIADTITILRDFTAAAGATTPPTPAGLDEPALVIYTSGSTGEPKGLVRTQRQIISRCAGYASELHAGPDDITLTLFSLTNGTGLSCLVTGLLTGGTICVAPPSQDGLRGVLDLLRNQSVTVLWAIPSLLRALLALPGAAASVRSLRATRSVSEPIRSSELQAWRRVLPPACGLLLSYGMTEAAGVATWFLPREPPDDGQRLPIGYPAPHYELAIINQAGEAASPGETGELWLRGPLVTKGEWRGGRCVPGRSVPDPMDPARFIIRTNDLVRLRADGLLEFAGRADDMVKILGNRVEPAEVEDALRRIDGIADAAVLPVHFNGRGSLLAFAVPAAEATLDHAAALRHMRAALPAYMVPSRLELLPALPRLPNGKVDRKWLEAEGARLIASG